MALSWESGSKVVPAPSRSAGAKSLLPEIALLEQPQRACRTVTRREIGTDQRPRRRPSDEIGSEPVLGGSHQETEVRRAPGRASAEREPPARQRTGTEARQERESSVRRHRLGRDHDTPAVRARRRRREQGGETENRGGNSLHRACRAISESSANGVPSHIVRPRTANFIASNAATDAPRPGDENRRRRSPRTSAAPRSIRRTAGNHAPPSASASASRTISTPPGRTAAAIRAKRASGASRARDSPARRGASPCGMRGCCTPSTPLRRCDHSGARPGARPRRPRNGARRRAGVASDRRRQARERFHPQVQP